MFAPDTPALYINQVNVDPNNAIPEGDEFNNQALEETTVFPVARTALNADDRAAMRKEMDARRGR